MEWGVGGKAGGKYPFINGFKSREMHLTRNLLPIVYKYSTRQHRTRIRSPPSSSSSASPSAFNREENNNNNNIYAYVYYIFPGRDKAALFSGFFYFTLFFHVMPWSQVYRVRVFTLNFPPRHRSVFAVSNGVRTRLLLYEILPIMSGPKVQKDGKIGNSPGSYNITAVWIMFSLGFISLAVSARPLSTQTFFFFI